MTGVGSRRPAQWHDGAVEAVIFDLDDTLIVEEDTARSAIARALSPVVDLSCDERLVDVALGCARRHWRDSPCHPSCLRLGIASWEGLWSTFAGCHRSLGAMVEWAPCYRRAAWRDTLCMLGADATRADEVARSYIDTQRQGHPPIDRAIEAVRWASDQVATAVLTNGPSDIQRLKLAQCGVDAMVDGVVVSGEAGCAKPEAVAFSLVLEQIGVKPSAAVMIGDSWERDVVGAVNAGLRAVWVSHGRPPPTERSGVLVIEELTVDALARL